MSRNTEIPGIRPDLAVVTCSNCGRELETNGNQSATAFPYRSIRVDCAECPARGTIRSNGYGYFEHISGDFQMRDRTETEAV